MRHFAVHLLSPKRERERDSAVSLEHLVTGWYKDERECLCPPEIDTRRTSKRARAYPFIRDVSLTYFTTPSSVWKKKRREGSCTRTSILSFNPPFLFPSAFTLEKLRSNPAGRTRCEKDRWCSVRNGGGKRQRRARRSARKRWRRRKEERVRFWSGKSRSTRSWSFARGWHNRKLSMSLGSRKERFALATRRFPSRKSSRFSTTFTIECRTLSFATLKRVENLTNGSLPACAMRALSRDATLIRDIHLSQFWEKYLHICRINVESVCAIYVHWRKIVRIENKKDDKEVILVFLFFKNSSKIVMLKNLCQFNFNKNVLCDSGKNLLKETR